MLGAALQIARAHREDRFYSPSKAWLSYRQHQQYLWRPRSSSSAGVSSIPPLVFKEKAIVFKCLESEDQTDLETGSSNAEFMSTFSASSSTFCSSLESENASFSNFDRFLESTTPSVPAQFFSKISMEGLRSSNVDCRPYFTLAELWESLKEWSAYGASVPLLLSGSDFVVQYYVPYLSGIQLYGKPSGRFGENSDSESSKNFTSDENSEYNSEKSTKSNGFIESTTNFIQNNDAAKKNGLSPNKGETEKSDGTLLFEFLEHNAPHSREPLTDKISNLSKHVPVLKSLRSCDLSPTSWISVAWYPIYRIPAGITLKDLDACFLTFHCLSTQTKDDDNSIQPVITVKEGSGLPKISLPAFGLTYYKLQASMWSPNGDCQSQRPITFLQQAADDWLRRLGVRLPDHKFFASHGPRCR